MYLHQYCSLGKNGEIKFVEEVGEMVHAERDPQNKPPLNINHQGSECRVLGLLHLHILIFILVVAHVKVENTPRNNVFG